jgi:hypothetical protein
MELQAEDGGGGGGGGDDMETVMEARLKSVREVLETHAVGPRCTLTPPDPQLKGAWTQVVSTLAPIK